MTLRTLATLSLLTALGALAACDDGESTPAPAGPAGPGAFVADYRGGGAFFSLMDGLRDGGSPHKLAQIWYSDNLADYVGKTAFTAPVGTVSIKEFDNDGAPGVDGLAVMIKQPAGYDPANNDWLYEMRTVDGAVMNDASGMAMSGKIGTCSTCHAAAAATDFLAGLRLRGGAELAGPGAFPALAEADPGLFTLMAGPVAGTSPHKTQQTWYSRNIRHLVHQSAFEAPLGTVAVKKFDMDQDGADDGYAVMIKEAAGFDAAHGDWRYEMRNLDGTLQNDAGGMPMSGAIGMCSSCHAAASDTDYLAGLAIR